MHSGHDHLTNHSEKINADYQFWTRHVSRNFDVALKIVIQATVDDQLTCIVCKDLSLNFHSQSSLASHYRYTHKPQIIEFYLKHLIGKTPDQLRQIIESNNTKSVNHIESEVLSS